MSTKNRKGWERYEKTAQDILKQLSVYFDLNDIEDKQKLKGNSGTKWEIDIVATSNSTERLVVIECRLTKARQSQEKLAAIAFKIQDVGAEAGIIVTPHPLQKGAKAVANSANITHFKLHKKSYSNNYLAEALGKMFIGLPSIGDTSKFGTAEIKLIPPA